MNKCPRCGNKLLVTVITNDINGNNIASMYKCEYCKFEISERKLLKILKSKNRIKK